MIYAERSLEKRRGLGILVDSKGRFSRTKGEVLNNQREEAAEGKRKEASAKPKRTVAGGGEGERGRASAKPKRTVAGGRGKEDGRFVLCSFFYLMLWMSSKVSEPESAMRVKED